MDHVDSVVRGDSVVVFGGGGQSEVVADIVRDVGADIATVAAGPGGSGMDDDSAIDFARRSNAACVVAIGDNAKRMDLIDRLRREGLRTPALVHPTATVSPSATVRQATVVHHHAHIGPSASVGMGCIVNTRAVIEHHVVVADGVHLAPGVVVAGGARIEARVFVGAGATVLPDVALGASAVVGAGAVVIRDVAAAAVVFGVPAQVQGRSEPPSQ